MSFSQRADRSVAIGNDARQRRYTRRSLVRGLGVAAGVLTLAPALAGCGEHRTGTPSATGRAGGSQPRRGGTLTVRMMGDVVNLDYAFTADLYSKFIINQCLEPLLALDQQLQHHGVLATSWEMPDDQTYIFKLRRGVTFQDGTAFTADAVDYSKKRLFQGGAAFAGQTPPAWETPDAATVKVTLPSSSATFLLIQTSTLSSVISPTTAESSGKDKLKLDLTGLGTGPFKFEDWKKDDHVNLSRNEAYWAKDGANSPLPYLDRVVARVIPDPTQALAALRNGEVDAFRQLEGPPAKDAAAVKADSSLGYRTSPGFGFNFIAFNVAREPFNNRELRQAVSYAIDREAIVQSVQAGQVPALDVLYASSSWAYDPDYHPYLKRDVGKAKELIAQAGRPNGFGFTLLISGQQSSAELIQDQLKEAGITMAIQQVDFARLQAAQRNGEQQAAFGGWGGDIDPSTIAPHFSSSGFQNFQSRYRNPDVDAILDRAIRTLEQPQRKGLYQQVQRIIMADAPYCMLFPVLNATLASSKVQAYPVRLGDYVSLGEVWKQA